MKQMTCAQMGGPCEAVLTGSNPEELMQNGMKHVEEAHPEMAEQIKAMPQAETAKWSADFNKKWDETPDMG
ncbi:MAG TPA: DUF1059 domain-containing protein [Candidatus Paceibacterota bacterium]|nr:DUF1059 domain-containing protein [Candidatus Paceibacterota bacterium]